MCFFFCIDMCWECYFLLTYNAYVLFFTTDPVSIGNITYLILKVLWLPQTQSVLGMSPINVQVHGYHRSSHGYHRLFFYNILYIYGSGYTHSIS